MKNLFQTLINLIIYIAYSYALLLMVIWYGKLPKVSIYHTLNQTYTFNEIFNDKLIQSKKNRPQLTKTEKAEVINELFQNPKLKKHLRKDVSLIDDLGDEYGETTLYNLIKAELLND